MTEMILFNDFTRTISTSSVQSSSVLESPIGNWDRVSLSSYTSGSLLKKNPKKDTKNESKSKKQQNFDLEPDYFSGMETQSIILNLLCTVMCNLIMTGSQEILYYYNNLLHKVRSRMIYNVSCTWNYTVRVHSILYTVLYCKYIKVYTKP